jgi:hypothetical protein
MNIRLRLSSPCKRHWALRTGPMRNSVTVLSRSTGNPWPGTILVHSKSLTIASRPDRAGSRRVAADGIMPRVGMRRTSKGIRRDITTPSLLMLHTPSPSDGSTRRDRDGNSTDLATEEFELSRRPLCRSRVSRRPGGRDQLGCSRTAPHVHPHVMAPVHLRRADGRPTPPWRSHQRRVTALSTRSPPHHLDQWPDHHRRRDAP